MRQRWVILVGAVLLGGSAFLPWIQVPLFGGLTMVQIARLTHHGQLGVFGAFLALAVALWASAGGRPTKLFRPASVVLAAAAGALALRLSLDIRHADGFVAVGLGAYIAIVAGLIILIGAMLPDRLPAGSVVAASPGSSLGPVISAALTPPPPSATAGWYPNPDQPGTLRWWDGSGWSSSVRTLPPPQGHEVR
jgi:hypothetical protein